MTAWTVFVLILVVALGREYWDKDPLALGRLQVPWPTFMLALLVLPLTVPRAGWRWTTVLRIPAPLGPMFFFWFCCGLSAIGVLVAPGPSSIGEFLKTFVHLTVYVVFVYGLVRWMTWRRLAVLTRAYYALGIAAALLAVLQFAHGGFGVFPWLAPLRFQSAEYEVAEGVTTGFRAASFFGEPSWAARYYVHFIALALAFWWRTRRRRHLAAVCLLLLAFYAANSLLGYVILGAFVAAGAAVFLWRRPAVGLSPRVRTGIAIAAVLGIVVWTAGMAPAFPDLLQRSFARVQLVFQGGGGAGNRIDSVFAGLEVWKLAPVLGVGLGNIDAYIVPFYQDPDWVLRSRYASDSVYVQLLAEAGIAGLLSFLWFWGRLLWFSAPRPFVAALGEESFEGYVVLRFLQLDLLAQAVGMINASDYLNPHLWTIVAIALTCKTLLLRERPAAAVAGL